jgi:hypothetical protein
VNEDRATNRGPATNETEVPAEVRRLAEERRVAREGRDFAAADALRERIREAGYEVTDTPEGPVLRLAQTPAPAGVPREGAGRLAEPASFDASLHWIAQGWPQDVLRGMASFDRHHPGWRIQHVVVDDLPRTGSWAQDWPPDAEVVPVEPSSGWAAGRNAGLRLTAAPLVVVLDGSVEAVGDVLGPLRAALADPTVGLTGPFGIASADLREFHASPGPEVDAVEGYLMAFRRDLLLQGVEFDRRFRFYRTADIELSFQVRSRGLRATVTDVPVERHEHRMWTNTPEDERARLSKRNFYRFLDRWRERTDLLVSGDPGPGES